MKRVARRLMRAVTGLAIGRKSSCLLDQWLAGGAEKRYVVVPYSIKTPGRYDLERAFETEEITQWDRDTSLVLDFGQEDCDMLAHEPRTAETIRYFR